MTSAYRTLEHHEHAEHMAHAGHGAAADHGSGHEPSGTGHSHASPAQWSALLVAFLAAGLAISEQGAKHAEIKVQQLAIDTADSWAQYQAKSIRGTMSADLAGVIAALDTTNDPAAAARRDQVVEKLKQDQERYENDPKDGKDAIAHRAREFEEQRHHALEQTHAYHNGSAAMELGIVLATASAITRSRMLIYMALGFGIAGVILSALGFFAPEYGAI